MKGIIVFHEKYYEISFAPPSLVDVWCSRVKLFMKLYQELGLEKEIGIVEPKPVIEELLQLVHSKEYIEFVKESSRKGYGYLDYGDTRSYPGVYEDALLAVGGTVTLLNNILEGKTRVGFNPQGGFHHAQVDRASGFCVFNDVALAAKYFQEKGFKPAVVDIDGHHGDGTQWILYEEPILKISFHMYFPGFYPGTGSVEELGRGKGYGYSVNIPLPPGTGDDMFIYALKELVIPLLESYKPDLLILQMGVDGHEGDLLVDLKLTTKSYDFFSNAMRMICEKYCKGVIGLGGGGYNPSAVARSWMLMLLNLVNVNGEKKDKLRDSTEGSESPQIVREEVKGRIEWLKKKLSEIHKL